MYESGHSPSVEDIRHALRRLDAALAAHHRLLADEDGAEGLAGALRRDLDRMRQEADRLRALLASR